MFDLTKLTPEQRARYRDERYNHDKYCDGKGTINIVNRFTLRVSEVPCVFCKRVNAQKRKRINGRKTA